MPELLFMAEYSKEYAKITGTGYYDFSYKEILEDLENGQYEACICEGLGTFGVHKKKWHLLFGCHLWWWFSWILIISKSIQGTIR